MKKLLNKKGFTIVELVIVIAVIAILAAVLIPTFSNVVDSAKETATLQEAKGTLDSYIGVMSSNGDSLPEGTVFVVFDSETDANTTPIATNKIAGAYVYYKGALHQFDYSKKESSTDTSITVPLLNDKGDRYTADSKIVWTADQKKDFIGAQTFEFYFYSQVAVKFDGGSTKCKIYGGSIKAIVKSITLTAAGADLGNAVSDTYTVSNLPITDDADLAITFTATTDPKDVTVKYVVTDGTEYAKVSDNVLTIAKGSHGKTIKVSATAGSKTIYIVINTKAATTGE